MGSGVDIMTFSALVLAFRVSEKVATPSSVVLMASISVWGVLWQGAVRGQIQPDAWDYWLVCLPVVIIGAPLGARFIKNRSRLFVARLLYLSIAIQYGGALLVIPQTVSLLLFNAGVVAIGLVLFRSLDRFGEGSP